VYVCVCDCTHETSGDGSVNFQGVVTPACAVLELRPGSQSLI